MLTFTAPDGAGIHIRAWYGDNGTGLLDLYVLAGSKFILVDENADPGQALDLDQHGGSQQLCIRSYGMSQTGATQPIFLLVTEGDVALASNVDVEKVGEDGSVRLDDAPHDEPRFYYFNVSVAA